MADFQEIMDNANKWLAETQEKILYYFQNCSQNELIAWGGNGLGFILLILGLFLL